MYKSLSIIAILATTALAGCNGTGVNANCAALGALGGGALGSVTHNNVAQSAIAGGVVGALAADQGMCR